MTVCAHDVAAALRERLPNLATKKLHKLLYYCQGHHLATFDEPLFAESIMAWDMGPVVGQLWYEERAGSSTEDRRELDEAKLNTIGYVISRYGSLTGADLERLTHSEAPWRLADSRRHPGESARIESIWIRDYFRGDAARNDGDDAEVRLDADAVHEWLRDAERRRYDERSVDDLDRLRGRLAGRATT
ncbi:MAG: Panacea domain-containing protein [Actinomycetota bacterium]|nr:Panacea domain-containing protein [Actinomycetota bacterium]